MKSLYFSEEERLEISSELQFLGRPDLIVMIEEWDSCPCDTVTRKRGDTVQSNWEKKTYNKPPFVFLPN